MSRDYKREAAKELENKSIVSLKIPKVLHENFMAKIEFEGVTKSAKVKELIEDYVYKK